MPSSFESWFAAYAQLGQLRVSTQALYLSALERYAFPRLGKKAVASVTREDIRSLIADLLTQGRSRSLVRNVVAPIRQAFNQLLEDGVVTVNPAAKIGRFLRDAGDPRSRVDPFTVEEEARFLEAAHRRRMSFTMPATSATPTRRCATIHASNSERRTRILPPTR